MKKILPLLSFLLLLVSCTAEIDEQFAGACAGEKLVFQASVEGCGMPDTKVYADENMKVLWNAGDQISIFNNSTYNWKFVFQGDDGDTAGDFEPVGDEGLGNKVDYIYAAYPYNELTQLGTDGVLTMMLPWTQEYKEKSFGVGANTMVAVSDGQFLAFKNVGGYLSLRLYGDDVSVSRIIIKGNNGEKISGMATVTMPMGGIPAVTMSDANAMGLVSLVCDPPVKLGESATSYTDFWFVLPPVTFSNGFEITVVDDKGATFKKATTNKYSVKRNTLDWMKPLKVEPTHQSANLPVPEAVDMGLSVKWASFNLGASVPEEWGDIYAWGETEPYYVEGFGYAQVGSQQTAIPIWKPGKEAGYYWPSYKWCMGSKSTLTKYCEYPDNGYEGFTDGKTVLDLEDDAAHVHLGGKWRMPTIDEFMELMENSTRAWTTVNGVEGFLVTSNKTNNSIFIPNEGVAEDVNIVGILSNQGGFYWTSTLQGGESWDAYAFYTVLWAPLNHDEVPDEVAWSTEHAMRFHGTAIRPVYAAN